MAVTYRNTGTYSSTSVMNNIPVPRPSGLTIGDLMLVGMQGILTAVHSDALTPPVGWTELANAVNGYFRIGFWWKIADAADVNGSGWTWITPITRKNWHAFNVAFSGVDQDNPFYEILSGSTDAVSPFDFPATTTLDDGAAIFLSAMSANQNNSISMPLIEIWDNGSFNDNGLRTAISYGLAATAGNYGGWTAAQSGTMWYSISATFSIRPFIVRKPTNTLSNLVPGMRTWHPRGLF